METEMLRDSALKLLFLARSQLAGTGDKNEPLCWFKTLSKRAAADVWSILMWVKEDRHAVRLSSGAAVLG